MPEWLLQLLVVLGVVGLGGYIWRMHENHDQERNENLWDQVGRSSNEGMRKDVHDVGNLRTRLVDAERRLEALERRVFNGHGVER